MGFLPLRGGHKTTPLMRFFPLGVSSSLMGFFPLGRLCLYALHVRFFSFGSIMQTCLRALSRPSYKNRNPPLWDFSHTESPTLLQEFSLSEPSFNVPLMRFFSFGAQTLAYGLLSSEPMSRWTPHSFSLSGSFYPYYDIGNTTLPGSCHPYSNDGVASLGSQLRYVISTTRRSTSLLGLLPHRGTDRHYG